VRPEASHEAPTAEIPVIDPHLAERFEILGRTGRVVQ